MTKPTAATAELVRDVLHAWFADSGDERTDLPRGARWFGGGAELDARLRAGFGGAIVAAARGDHDAALADAHGALALVVLLDQFPRNVHRGEARAFAFGGHALAMARLALARGHDAALPLVQRVFLALPFEHDESRESQHDAVRLLQGIADGADGARAPGDEVAIAIADFARSALDSAREHAAIVERFGRYPYRNAVLGRASTPDEEAWLTSGAQRFGQ